MHTRSKGKLVQPLILNFERRHRRRNSIEEQDMANNQDYEALRKELEDMRAWRDEQERKANEAQPPPLNHIFQSPMAQQALLNQMFEPPTQQFQGGAWGTINANNFELKSGLIQMIKSEQFGGSPMEETQTLTLAHS